MTTYEPSPPRRRANARTLSALIITASLCAWLTPPASVAAGARAQTPAPTTAPQQQQRPRRVLPPDESAQGALESDEVVRVETDLVRVEVTVTDARGEPVRDLRAEDFKLYEDGVERPVAFFNVERKGGAPRPVAVVFAVDVSGSVTAEEVARLGDAMRAFAAQMRGREAVFAVMSFGTDVEVQQSFTDDPAKLARAAQKIARDVDGHSTHAYDAVDDAVRLLARKAPRTRNRRLMKRAVVVISDGFPVGDTVSPATVIERAQAAEVSVYAVTLPSYSRLLASGDRRRAPLPTPFDVSGVVERTGGTSSYATDKDFGPLFEALAAEVTSAYVLAFYPPEAHRRDGRTHSLRVTAPPGLQVRQSRTEYISSDK